MTVTMTVTMTKKIRYKYGPIDGFQFLLASVFEKLVDMSKSRYVHQSQPTSATNNLCMFTNVCGVAYIFSQTSTKWVVSSESLPTACT